MIKVNPLELKSEHWPPGTYLIEGDSYLTGGVPVPGEHKGHELISQGPYIDSAFALVHPSREAGLHLPVFSPVRWSPKTVRNLKEK